MIAFVGRSGSGKTTAAKYVVANWPNAKRICIAMPIKQMAGELLDLTTAQLYGDSKNRPDCRYPFTPREFMQSLGDAGRKYLGESVWLDAFLNWATPGSLWVVDDCRFENEARAIIGRRGKLIKLEGRYDRGTPKNHATEAAIDRIPEELFSGIIQNTGSLQDLYKAIDKVLSLS